MGGVRRGASGHGRAGWEGGGWMRPARRQIRASVRKPIILPLRAPKKPVLDVFSKARSMVLCKSDRKTQRMGNELVESKTRVYHGRVGPGWRTAGRRGEAGLGRTQTGRSTYVGDSCPTHSSDEGRITPWACPWKHEQRKPHVNRWRSKNRS